MCGVAGPARCSQYSCLRRSRPLGSQGPKPDCVALVLYLLHDTPRILVSLPVCVPSPCLVVLHLINRSAAFMMVMLTENSCSSVDEAGLLQWDVPRPETYHSPGRVSRIGPLTEIGPLTYGACNSRRQLACSKIICHQRDQRTLHELLNGRLGPLLVWPDRNSCRDWGNACVKSNRHDPHQ